MVSVHSKNAILTTLKVHIDALTEHVCILSILLVKLNKEDLLTDNMAVLINEQNWTETGVAREVVKRSF